MVFRLGLGWFGVIDLDDSTMLKLSHSDATHEKSARDQLREKLD